MVNYGNGKIYKLVSPHTDDIYIGSTCSTLARRKAHHKTEYTRWKKNEKVKNCSSVKIFDFGKDDVKIVLVEKFSCADKMELHKRERYWIEKLDCCNKCIPTRTKKEWYQVNKEVKKAKSKKWKEENKGKIKIRSKTYYQENKEKIKIASKVYKEKNKEKIKSKFCEKVTCECGSVVNKYGIPKHKKSKKHKAFMEAK